MNTITMGEALRALEDAALNGVTLSGDDIPRLRASVARLTLEDDPVLPCDVRVAPATTVRAGCKLSMLLKSIELRRGEDPPPRFPADLTLQQQIADLNCTLWMVLKSAGGKVTVHRRIQREFNPSRASLVRHDDGDGDVTFEAKERT